MSRRGKRGASLGKKFYPPESFYIEFDEIGAATGETAGRFNTWFGNTVKELAPYHLEWIKMEKKTHDQLKEHIWLRTTETWKFLNDSENAKEAQLSKVNGIHRSFRNTLVDFVRLNYQPFDTYKFLPKNLEHWEKFVAYTTSEEFLAKSAKAKKSALQNKDPARVGRSGYAGLRALWKAKKEELIEKIPFLGMLQSGRSILHVLGRRKMNKETGVKELTKFVCDRLDALGKEHGGRTRSASSTQGSKKVLGCNKGESMQKVSMKDLESMAGKILADVKPEMDELRADIATLKKISNDMPSGVLDHITVDKFDEIEYCDVMTIHFGMEVKVGQGIIYPKNQHMEPGYLKIQVDTVYPGWEGFKVPRPTDEVMFLGDATKDARFIQWPKKYLKVFPRISLNNVTCPSSSTQLYPLNTSSSPLLHHPSTSSSPPLYHLNTSSIQPFDHPTMTNSPPFYHPSTSSSPPLYHPNTSSIPSFEHPTMTNSPPFDHHTQEVHLSIIRL